MARNTQTALVYRQRIPTRVTHWLWAMCLFFLLLSGLQIFMARPDLYIGQQSGFTFDNSVLSIDATQQGDGTLAGYVDLFGHRFDTTGWLGVVNTDQGPTPRSFPTWATIPSFRDLGTGRVVHFFFAWTLAGTLFAWFLFSLFNGHLRKDLLPRPHDLRALPRDVWNHLRLRFEHRREYNVLQKLSYFSVLFVALPLMFATGLTMSPGVNSLAPWMLDLFGGRQTARTIHFAVMLALVLFFVVHVAMVVLAGPFNEMRSMITGWYRAEPRSADAEV
ncbi:cytochrome b/b6 domain-containing protein [Aureimonas leprariae]|uniref:Cytochrome b/b6 domain-containing protein n=1 Tax=Plantimonas leprariae TaxID=2615207 RepID=A0A7V7TY45_9HYPH|nr:cytochrome b/b6 domain-containing protein [Aureimonas leprariae]KAB0676663.1 cytochrome b/b6 domain-containing protein [Aureimonas leprariae]